MKKSLFVCKDPTKKKNSCVRQNLFIFLHSKTQLNETMKHQSNPQCTLACGLVPVCGLTCRDVVAQIVSVTLVTILLYHINIWPDVVAQIVSVTLITLFMLVSAFACQRRTVVYVAYMLPLP